MYSVVLAVAITAAPATANWHRSYGCYSCHGCYSSCHGCYGCYGGPAGYAGNPGYFGYSCHGGYPGYSCHGSASGGGAQASPEVRLYGGAGAGYGYHGGCYGAGYGANYYFDPAMHGCSGCYGAYGGQSGYGIPVPADPKGSPKPVDPFPPLEPEIKKEPKGAEEIAPPKEVKPKSSIAPYNQNQRAIVRVDVPEGGKLYVDGQHINVAPGMRAFQTPELALGQRFFYDMKIEIEIAGVLRKEEQCVFVERGMEIAVDFPNMRAAGTQTARRKE